jgi:hypothetical protein
MTWWRRSAGKRKDTVSIERAALALDSMVLDSKSRREMVEE